MVPGTQEGKREHVRSWMAREETLSQGREHHLSESYQSPFFFFFSILQGPSNLPISCTSSLSAGPLTCAGCAIVQPGPLRANTFSTPELLGVLMADAPGWTSSPGVQRLSLLAPVCVTSKGPSPLQGSEDQPRPGGQLESVASSIKGQAC